MRQGNHWTDTRSTTITAYRVARSGALSTAFVSRGFEFRVQLRFTCLNLCIAAQNQSSKTRPVAVAACIVGSTERNGVETDQRRLAQSTDDAETALKRHSAAETVVTPGLSATVASPSGPDASLSPPTPSTAQSPDSPRSTPAGADEEIGASFSGPPSKRQRLSVGSFEERDSRDVDAERSFDESDDNMSTECAVIQPQPGLKPRLSLLYLLLSVQHLLNKNALPLNFLQTHSAICSSCHKLPRQFAFYNRFKSSRPDTDRTQTGSGQPADRFNLTDRAQANFCQYYDLPLKMKWLTIYMHANRPIADSREL